MIKVLKAFNTRLRRYAAGDEILAGADLSPHTLESLAAGQFISAPPKSSKK